MSDNSPRWPGNNGSPGLDFSARRDAPAGAPATGASAGGQDEAGPVSQNAPRPTRPTPPPFDPSAQPVPVPQPSGKSVQTPSRSDGASAAPPSDGPPGNRNGAAAKQQDLPAPGPQESAAAWAWQPLDADSAGKSATSAAGAPRPGRAAGPGPGGAPGSLDAPGRTAAAAANARAGETALRPASEVGAAAAAGVIAGAAVKAADQTRQQPGAPRRHTPSSAVSAPRTASLRNGMRRTRKARLRLARLDPWSVMKTTFLFSIAFGIMMMVIAWVLWTVLAGSGALESLNQFLTTLIGNQGDAPFRIEDYINAPRVLGAAAVLAAIDVVILTAVATLFAFLYNLAATVIGGLEVTLAED